jgi:hypothetical protein
LSGKKLLQLGLDAVPQGGGYRSSGVSWLHQG